MQNFLFLVLQNSILQSELVVQWRWTSGKCQTSWHNSKIDHLVVHTRHNQVTLLLNSLVLKYRCILSCFHHDSWSLFHAYHRPVGISFKIFFTFRTVFFALCNTTTLDWITCLLWVVIFHTFSTIRPEKCETYKHFLSNMNVLVKGKKIALTNSQKCKMT